MNSDHYMLKFIQSYSNVNILTQYSRKETIELNTVPADIREDVLEENICKILSVTGVNFIPNDLHTCHQMKRSVRVIVKFKCHKPENSIMYKRKNIGSKSQKLINLKFSGALFLSESMSRKNQQL